jgi:integrase
MSVTVRPYVNGGWEVDIRVQLADGSVIRERKKAAASSKQAAQKWAESRERVLLVYGKPKPAKEDVQIKLLKAPKNDASFQDFDEFERLVEVARSEPLALLAVLLGGEAGLRCGEIMALEWTDVDFAKRQLTVARSEWKGHLTMPKGGRIRYVPLTRRLSDALRAARHLRGQRVLCDSEGKPLSQKVMQVMVRRVARRANVRPGLHILRHSFCSHLARRGAPARAIQELAGHQDLGTMQR